MIKEYLIDNGRKRSFIVTVPLEEGRKFRNGTYRVQMFDSGVITDESGEVIFNAFKEDSAILRFVEVQGANTNESNPVGS